MKAKLLIIFFLASFNNIKCQENYYKTVNSIAEIVHLYADSKFHKIIPKIDNALEIAKKIDNEKSVNYAMLLQIAGTTNMQINRIPESINYYNKARHIWKLLEDVNNENNLIIFTNLAKLHQHKGVYNKAEFYYKKALEVAAKIYGKSNSKYYEYLYNLGNFYYNYFEKEKCIQVLELHTNYLEENIKRTDFNFLMGKLKIADYYASFGKQEKRFQILEEIIPRIIIHKESKNLKNSFILRSLAIHYYYQGNLEMSFQYFYKILEHYSKGYMYDFIDPISKKFSKSKDLKEAISFQIQKLNRFNFLGKGINYREFEDITILFRKFLELPNVLNIAEIFFRENIKSLQEKIYNDHILMTESEKQKSFSLLNSYYSTYYSYIIHLSEGEKMSLATNVYNIVLSQKNQLLKSTVALKKTIFNSKDTILKANYKEWVKLKNRITEWKYSNELKEQQEYDILISKFNELERMLILQSRVYESYKNRITTTYFDVNDNLKQNEYAVEFIDFDYYDGINTYKKYYYALIINSTSIYPSFVYLFNEDELKQVLLNNIDNEKEGITNLYGSVKTPNTSLYNLVWKPIEKSFYTYSNKKPTIYYSPSGLLNKVSFSALRNEKGFLMEQYNLNQVSTTRNLLNKSTVVIDSLKTIGLVGGIDYGVNNYEWDYLEGTAKEVKNISTFLKAKNLSISLLEGKKATKNNFSLTIVNKDIVHIATHGYFQEEIDILQYPIERGKINLARSSLVNTLIPYKEPLLRSGLIFAPNLKRNSKQSIKLNGLEISQLNFENTKLVVLSACETGLGDIKGMQGVYGLQRAFKLAGVEKMIISLWKVPDLETQEFMENFYTLLFKEKEISFAFKKTQLAMSQKYDPYFWASFILLD